MTDDLKQQKAHAAWENVARNDIRSAVEASIEAAMYEYLFRATTVAEGSIAAALAEALAPVLERVARLEELAQFPTLMAENDALLQKMAAASPEGETAGTRHGQYQCPACAAGMVEEAPVATQGIPQSGQQAPERVTLFLDPKSGGIMLHPDTMTRPLQAQPYVRADVFALAERRIAELEQSDRNMADIIRGLENGLGEAQKEARAEGREAGIREAIDVVKRERPAKKRAP